MCFRNDGNATRVFSGNGKRSGPPSDSSDTLDRSKPFILGQLLLKNRSLMPELLSNYPDDSSDLIEQDNVYPDNDDVVREQILERQQILERVNSILSDMVSTFLYLRFCTKLVEVSIQNPKRFWSKEFALSSKFKLWILASVSISSNVWTPGKPCLHSVVFILITCPCN